MRSRLIREDIKRQLEDNISSKAELATILNTTSSAIDHNINYLLKEGWVVEVNGKYSALTAEQRLVLLRRRGVVRKAPAVIKEKETVAA